MRQKLSYIQKEVDRRMLMRSLAEYYDGESDLEALEKLLKADFKTKKKMMALIKHCKMDTEEFFIYLASLFSKKLFNKLMINKIRTHLADEDRP